MDFYKRSIPILDTDGPTTALSHPRNVGFGCVPRDYTVDPPTMFASPTEMQLIEPSDYDAWYDEQEDEQSSLEHIYLSGPNGTPAFVNLDQNGHGYCWAYSTGHAMMLDRMKQNLPMVRLNPHATAAIIKGGRDEGGWCGLSAKWASEHGYAVEGEGPGQWPLHNRILRHDTPALRESMALHRVTEDWVDLTKPVYGQNLTERQLDTCLFNNIPCPTDFYWWGHSVCSIRKVRISKGEWGRLILNSWKGWGRHGLAVLRGTQAIPNGAIAIRSTSPSVR